MLAFTGLAPAGNTFHSGPPSGAWSAMPPAQPPGTPTFPVIAAQHAPRAHHLLAVRAALHAVALVEDAWLDAWRTRGRCALMVSRGTPVMRSAHAGVFGMPSRVPRM